jgi:GTP-binding protein
MIRARQVLARCDVAWIVLDASQGLTRDDRRIITEAFEAGCGLMLLINKWDMIKGIKLHRLNEAVRRAVPYAAAAPVLAISAKTGFQLDRLIPMSRRLVRTLREGVSESTCVDLLRQAWEARRPPRVRGRAIQLQKAWWIPGKPARLELITRPIGMLPPPYVRYLLNYLHAHPLLAGIPIHLEVKGAGGPVRKRRP